MFEKLSEGESMREERDSERMKDRGRETGTGTYRHREKHREAEIFHLLNDFFYKICKERSKTEKENITIEYYVFEIV